MDDLRALLVLFNDEGAQLRVSAPVYGARQFGDTIATEELEMRLTWRSNFGRTRNAIIGIRGVVKGTPSESTACQIVRASGLR